MKDALKSLILASTLTFAPFVADAGETRVVGAKAALQSTSDTVETWRFDVTLEHADTGWEHYADAFEIVSIDGDVLGVRVLYHPHVNEQPFTRSLSGVEIPVGTEKVLVRGQDNQHGYGLAIELELERPD